MLQVERSPAHPTKEQDPKEGGAEIKELVLQIEGPAKRLRIMAYNEERDSITTSEATRQILYNTCERRRRKVHTIIGLNILFLTISLSLQSHIDLSIRGGVTTIPLSGATLHHQRFLVL